LTTTTTPGWKIWTRRSRVGSKPISQSSSAAMCSRSSEALDHSRAFAFQAAAP
jgi:hypothetical protein